MSTEQRCGYAIEDKDGNQEPCDRPATGWRWYQDVGDHEDLLDVACDWHANEGGQRIHDAERLRDAVQSLCERWECESSQRGPEDSVYTAGVASMLRDALAESEAK